MKNTIKNKAPRQRKPAERSLAVVIRPSAGQPLALVRITQGKEVKHYWVEAVPSDWGRAFKVQRPGHEDGRCTTYNVCLEENGQADSCDCPGNTFGGKCRHVSALRVLDSLGQLPAEDGYKPDGNSFIPF